MKKLLIMTISLIFAGSIEAIARKSMDSQLEDAINSSDIPLIKKRLQNKSVDINGTNPAFGNITVIHMAAIQGDKDIMKALLNSLSTKKPNVNVQDKWGNTPLHIAAEKGHEGIIAY